MLRVVPPDSGMDHPVHNDSGELTLRNSRSVQQVGQLSIGSQL